MPFIPIERYPLPWVFGTSTLLGDGSTVLPGNWWRIIQSNNVPANEGGRLQYRLEQIFEEVRLKHAPDAPSRQFCVFVCPSENAANRFKTNQADRRDVWYKIEPTEKLAHVFLARWNLVNRNDVRDAARVHGLAKRYWTEEEQDGPIEMLLPCAVRIVGRM